MHYSTKICARDLSNCGFWYPQGALGPVPHGYQGMTIVNFGGSQKLYANQLHVRLHP